MSLRLDQLLGQEEAARRLTALDAHGRIPHALLFEGPEGVGKRAAAKCLAQALLCQAPERAPGAACGSCAACLKVSSGNHADLHLIEGTPEQTKLNIELVRQAEQALRLRPLEGERKVVVVVDAHRLNVNAQNAFLKTLEEPPRGTHLILTTSRLRAILPTVVSRCQRVPFRPIPLRTLAAAVAEQRQLPLPQATLAAALAGSLGRALELDLEPLIETRDRLADLDRRLSHRSPRTAMTALQLAAELGDDRAEAISKLELLGSWLHDQLVLASGTRDAELASADRRAELERLAHERGLSRISARLRAVMEARRLLESTFNFNPLMVAEQLCLTLAGHQPLVISERA